MLNKETIQALLYRSLEEELTAEERPQLEAGLQAFPDLKAERARVLSLRKKLKAFTVSATPADFSESVLQKRQQAKVVALNNWAPQIAAACVVLALAFVLSLYFGEGNLDTATLLGIENLSPEEAYTLLNY